MAKSKLIEEPIKEITLEDLAQDFLEDIETNSVIEAITIDNSTPILMNDPIAMQVRALRLRGWDNNRIAALLGVDRVNVVDKIQ